MFRSVSTVLLLLTCAAFAASQDQTPPKELIQYIRDAEKAGQSVFQIQQNAVNSGWPVSTVTQAITYVRDEQAAKQAAKQAVPTGKPAAPEATEASLAAKPDPAPAANGTASTATTLPAPGGTPPAKDAKPGETAKPPAAGGTKPEKINRGVPDDYQIGAGDVIEINVWKEPDASVHGAMVRTDGKISMPLLKDVGVVGLTPLQLEKLITDKLSSLIDAPDVTIIVTGTGSKKIYVQGKVNREGPIPFTYNMTVMQALSEAGGITAYAHKSKIYILRTVNGTAFQLPFDYAAVLKGHRLELNIQIQAGDMIVVP